MSKNDKENARIAKTAIANIFNNDDLQEVYDILKQRWDINTKEQVNQFSVGQDVECYFKSGNYYPAVVEKINKKTVGIKVSLPYNSVKKYNVNPKWLRNLETN